ncbi:adenine-specific methyltransferase EcoRI family protein [Dyadobacter sp. CY107]|uniref:adenine-specific methyltransferase EcoRI family protein n=1 Tax=Dyadobacter fanqingshengii TaxID=2906443 RepID=UPI001F40B97A|nr:adenine-specific methyltransferase EcoRI family protein [Dyadobacter fanqingshengii]MCF2502577.1 adenine-specific methyltransferase EcoRI family protein [Dyadobacter fanqingshengii]
MGKSLNTNLAKAKSGKNDEFYTQLSDIDKELKHYRNHFKDKVILCNCDDPRVSKFFHYFSYNFEKLGLKKLIATCYKSQDCDLFSQNKSEQAIFLEYNGDKNGDNFPNPEEIGIIPLQGDGDFRSKECIELLKQADIVVTNPPFSLFREYIAQLIEYDKKFLIIGHQNAITYKEVFQLIQEDKIWLGVDNGGTKWFQVNDDYDIATESRKKIENGQKYFSMGSIVWFTNLDIKKRHENLILYRTYNSEEYPTYDNYDAINVDKVADIPIDYAGVMGVPITFIDKYNPRQFEIIGITKAVGFHLRTKLYPQQVQVDTNGKRTLVTKLNDGATIKLNSAPKDKTYYVVDDKYYVQMYARVLIKRK